MARTKIVATIGPASWAPETIRQLLRAGMNVARVNFSHGDHETHRNTINRLREVASGEGVPLAILGDLQGPKLRFGQIAAGGIPLKQNEEIVLTPHRGQPAMIHLPHPDLIAAVQPGARLIVGDGEIELRVIEKLDDALRCVVVVPGLLEARKGINVPGTALDISSITAKDRLDLKFICEQELDYIALSFVRSADDIIELKSLIAAETDQRLPVIAKIEKAEAIEQLEAIGEAADGMMVARGDLGIDLPPERVPLLQKRIINCCNQLGKPVITATQMLQSMIEHPRPTRAEASDVANAILDGSDAIMLSGETATGKYPVQAVRMMATISRITEEEFPFEQWRNRRVDRARSGGSVTSAISEASCSIAEEVSARAIVSSTMTGGTARQIARHRPRTPVIAVTPLPRTQRWLQLVWGVQSALIQQVSDTDAMIEETMRAVKAHGLHQGERIVITAGVPFGRTGQTNLIQVHEIW